MRRRTAVLLAAAVLACAVGAVLLSRVAGHPAAPARDRGELTQAVLDWRTHQGTPRTTIAADAAHQAVVGSAAVTWYDATGTEYQTTVDSPDQVVRLFDDNGYSDWRQETGGGAAVAVNLLPALLILAIVGVAFWQLRRSGAPGLSMGRSRARVIDGADRPQTRFTDVAGVDSAKQELVEVVDFLRRPERYTAMGARIPRGVLLAGPPGTGKTLLARAVAGEAGVPFLSLSGSEFVEMFVGVGASRVRSLFAQARRLSPSIVFVDEIDAVGRRRGSGHGHSNDEREQTLNQLLVELDGFDSEAPVIVIAATNRADVLDPALLRPGRFDRHVGVDAPDIAGRTAILEVHGRGKPVADGVDWRTLARQTPGFSGADLANLLNEAALLAARDDAPSIDQDHLEEATARVVAGPRREGRLMTPRETEVIAYHEMGHALVYHVLPGTDPVHRVSIVSRGRALGWTMTVPESDRVLGSRAQLVDQLAGLLGGRCAEELVFGEAEVTTGAQDDIERATRLARRMVTEWGMSPLGLRAFPDAEPGSPRPHAEATAAAVDAEVDRLLEDAGRRARRVLGDRRDLLDRLAARLLEVETVDGDELIAIVAAHPAGSLPAPPASPPAGREAIAAAPARPELRALDGGAAPSPLPPLRRGLGRRAAGIAAAVRTALATRPTQA